MKSGLIGGTTLLLQVLSRMKSNLINWIIERLHRGSLAIAAIIFSAAINALEVPLKKDAGVYTIPVRINNVLTLDFIIDSGASEVQVPADVVMALLRTGTISMDDFLPGQTYQLADGSRIKSGRFIIKELKIGTYKVTRVEAGISPVEGPLLLGQSFLSKVPSWSQDNRRGILIIDKIDKSSVTNKATSTTKRPTRSKTHSHLQNIIANGGSSTVKCAFRGIQASKPCHVVVKKELVTHPGFVSWYGKTASVDVLNITWPDGDHSKYTWSDSGELLNLNEKNPWGYTLSGNEVEQDWSRGFVIEKHGVEFIRLW